MNLELLDPFGRQIPDRLDATVHLPASLHFRHHDVVEPHKKKGETADQEWKAAYHVSFNRRGTHLAVGYGSGAVGVHNFLNRTLSALFRNEDPSVTPGNLKKGVTSVTWSRRSRTLLTGAAGDAAVQLFDTTHPYGPEESCLGLYTDDGDEETTSAPRKLTQPDTGDIPPTHTMEQTKGTSFRDEKTVYAFLKERKDLSSEVLAMGSEAPAQQVRRYEGIAHARALNKYPSIAFRFPHAVGGSLQVNPHYPTGGLAALVNGSLVLFWVHSSVWVDGDGYMSPKVQIVTLYDDPKHFFTCAHFDPHGKKVYAATKDGSLVGFDVENLLDALCTKLDDSRKLPVVEPSFTITIPGSSSAWHLLVSRNGKYLVVNSADGALRLYSTQDCWERPDQVEKPTWVFQDVVSKVKFASCDLSGDGEYVVGGANGDDNKYELYIWNTSTGALMDKLTGASVQLYSVAWHPTRSFLAVATSDGLVDIWGPRINWTAFAPDFQALPMNVEYVEREDEFDVDEHGKYLADMDTGNQSGDSENAPVDVFTIDPVPVFASDSEDEEEVFTFETRVKNLVAGRGTRGRSAAADD
jgi:WD40 repeat protein